MIRDMLTRRQLRVGRGCRVPDKGAINLSVCAIGSVPHSVAQQIPKRFSGDKGVARSAGDRDNGSSAPIPDLKLQNATRNPQIWPMTLLPAFCLRTLVYGYKLYIY